MPEQLRSNSLAPSPLSSDLTALVQSQSRLFGQVEQGRSIALDLTRKLEMMINSAQTAPGPKSAQLLALTASIRQLLSSHNAELLKLQMAMQRENQVFSSVSNVLKTRHDTTKNSIGNIR